MLSSKRNISIFSFLFNTVLALALLTGSAAFPGSVLAVAAYTLTDLGTLGGSYSYPTAINEAGQVIGYSHLAGNASYHAFVWEGGVLTDLGTLGGSFSQPTAINEAGQVAGYSYLAGNASSHAFVWEGGVLTDLGTFGGSYSYPLTINEAGQVVGYSYLAGNASVHAFVWEGGVTTDLGTLGGNYSYPTAINEAGEVVGYSNTAGGQQHAFVWEGGVMTDLGTLGGSYSFPLAINEAGQIIGYSYLPGNLSYHAFVWEGGVLTDLGTLGGSYSRPTAINGAGQVVGYSNTAGGQQHAFVWEGGVLTDLGTLGGSSSNAQAINEAGQAIGQSKTAGDASAHAFVWEGGVMTDLGTLGGSFSYPLAINEAGQIAGYSYLPGNLSHHAFVWEGGVLTDLGTLGGSSSYALTINEAGQVLGYSDLAGDASYHAFVATPMVVNQPPVASAGGPYTGDEGSAIALSGASASDPDGDTLSYTWSTYSGLCSFDDASLLNPSLTCSDNGSFTVTLEVSDGSETASSDAGVTVGNVAPTAVFGNNAPVNEGEDINLSLTSPYDPSSADTAAGFQYAFDCGSGYGAPGSANTATCSTADNGVRTVRGKIQDKDGGFTEYTAGVAVNNLEPNVTAASGAVTVEEGQTAYNSGSYSDVPADTVGLSADAGSLVDNGDGTWSWSFASSDGPAESTLVTLTAQDEDGGSSHVSFDLVVDNVAPALGAISVDNALVTVGTTINASAAFTDPGTLDTHTAAWDWGDSTTSAGSISEAGGNGTASGSHSYGTPGVYTLRLIVTDKDGADSNESIFQYVVVSGLEAGFVTGGGWIDSPAGANAADPSLTGKASFGFVARNKKDPSMPDGNTEFKSGDLHFKSTSYASLVVAGASAQFTGEGTINGRGRYGFMLTVTDGRIAGGLDMFRIRIWDMENGDAVVYDSQMGAPADAGATTPLGGGSIVIHK